MATVRPLICMVCSMRAFVNNEEPPTFHETPEAHIARCHPDPIETAVEKRRLTEQITQAMQERHAMAENARNN